MVAVEAFPTSMPTEPFTLFSQTTWASFWMRQTMGQWQTCKQPKFATLNTLTTLHLLPVLPVTSPQLQLNRFYTYTNVKGLSLNAHEIKIMAFFFSNPPVLCCNGTLLENVQEFRYLGMTLSHNWRMTNASNEMARTFLRHRFLRVGTFEQEAWNAVMKCSGFFIIFALSARLCGCHVWATNTLMFESGIYQ